MKERKRKKEEIAEDYCFVCKDGGLLLVCEYKDCLKAYHTECVGKDDSFLESGKRWTCNWHYCFVCRKIPKYHCFVCPTAVCTRCFGDSGFVHLRRWKGLCSACLKLALLVEENRDVDSDGEKVDFKDRETYECLFMEYWEIIKEKEGLTFENLRSEVDRLMKGKTYKSISDSDGKDEDEFQPILSECSDTDDDTDEYKPKRGNKKSKWQKSVVKRKEKSNEKGFTGWGTKSLMTFLKSIGKDTSNKLSQDDVLSIINDYINENKLLDPEKKKQVVCDSRLRSLLRRKKVNKYKINDILETHLAENFEVSEEDDTEYSSEEKTEKSFIACKRQKKFHCEGNSWKMDVGVELKQSCFASIVAKNIKLVYLRRSLIEELLKKPETFESKVMGSFVRIKSDPNDYLCRSSHQLLQVTGIKKTPGGGETNDNTLLQVSNTPKDISICMLSDDDFSEEECDDLHQKMKDGILKKPTVVELEAKARRLHEDMVKHWIVRELARLQNLIDRANEKGWRGQLYQYMEKRQLLLSFPEQSRLLQEVPNVLADVKPEPAHDVCPEKDKASIGDSSKSTPVKNLKVSSNTLEGTGITSSPIRKTAAAAMIGVKQQHHVPSDPEEEDQYPSGQQSHNVAFEDQSDITLQSGSKQNHLISGIEQP